MPASNLTATLLGGDSGAVGLVDPSLASLQSDLQTGQALTQQGLSTAPASGWQAAGRLAQVLAGSYLQKSASSDLGRAMAHSADAMADALPEGHPLKAPLKGNDPIAKMQAIQTWPKAMTLLSEPRTSKGGEQTVVGSAPIFTSNMPTSDEGRREADVRRYSGQPPVPPPAPLPGTRPPLLTAPPIAPAAAAPATSVPLNPPRIGGINPTAPAAAAPVAPANVPLTAPVVPPSAPPTVAPAAAALPKAQPTVVPSNPLQGAIDLDAKKAAAVKSAEKQAEAGVEYGDLLKPQPAPQKGPGGTEPLEVYHNNPATGKSQKTVLPPVTDQAPIPQTPAELKETVPAWRKTVSDWNTSSQASQQAEQRLNSIASAFKQIQTGEWTTDKAHFAAMLKSAGLDPTKFNLDDPAAAQTALHENYVETLQQLKASTPRFTQMEFKALSENKEHPNLQPSANLQMLSEDIAQLRQSRDIPRDFAIAQQHGWRDPQSFEQAWLRQNPLKGYVDQARAEIGPLKGMPGNEPGAAGPKAAAANGSWTDPKTGKSYQVINGKLHE